MFNPTPKLLEMFAHTVAMMETLAENRIITEQLFKFISQEHIQKFQENSMSVIHYIDGIDFDKED